MVTGVIRLIEVYYDAEATPDLDPKRVYRNGQSGFQGFHVGYHANAGWTWQAKRPLRGIGIVKVELDAREMAARTTGLLHPMRGRRRAAASRVLFRRLERCDGVQEIATVEGSMVGVVRPRVPMGRRFKRERGVFGLLQHQYGEIRKGQLAGEKQADRAGSGNQYVKVSQIGSPYGLDHFLLVRAIDRRPVWLPQVFAGIALATRCSIPASSRSDGPGSKQRQA